MQVGLDAFAAVGRGGNSTYSRELIVQLLAQGANRYDLFVHAHDLFRRQFSGGNEMHVRLSPSYFPLPFLEKINEILLRARARMRGVEIFHFTNPLNYTPGHYKTVVTIHDLAFLHDKSWAKASPGKMFKEKLQQIRKADAIIAVSQATKQDIIKQLGVPATKITVVYEGAGKEYFPDSERPSVQGRYLLCVGQLQPRKNNRALIEAFSLVAPKFPDLKLVFAGRSVSKEYLESLHAAARAANLQEKVIFIHSADNADLRKLYSHAECLVYPSLFEGFGLPVLESFQCGVSVITSNLSSLPEVAGEAGLLVDPHSPQKIAEALEQFLTDETLRNRLRAAIPAQLQKFSWERAARETAQVYATLS